MPKTLVAPTRASFSQRAGLRIFSMCIVIAATITSWPAAAQPQSPDDASGPYTVTNFEGGEGLARKLTAQTASLGANEPWTLSGWVKPQRRQDKAAVLLAVGSSPEAAR